MSKRMFFTPEEASEAKNSLVMPRHQIDHIDLKILTVLQREARLTNIDLSGRIGLTAPPVLRRTRTLEDAGYIRGYHASLDAKKLGFDVCAFVFVSLVSQAKNDIDAFEHMILSWPIVRECYALTGKIDFLLKCVARNSTSFQLFITQSLMTTPNVEAVKSMLVIQTSKEAPAVPLSQHGG